MGSGASVADDGPERIDENQESSEAEDNHTGSEVLKSDYLRGSMLLKNVPKDILTVSDALPVHHIYRKTYPFASIDYQNPRWCSGFKRYISECYINDISSMMDAATALQLRDIALNFLLFWLDVSGKFYLGNSKLLPDASGMGVPPSSCMVFLFLNSTSFLWLQKISRLCPTIQPSEA